MSKLLVLTVGTETFVVTLSNVTYVDIFNPDAVKINFTDGSSLALPIMIEDYLYVIRGLPSKCGYILNV